MKRGTVLFFILLGIWLGAQSHKAIDFDGIRKAVTDSASTYFYERMLYRFQFNPTAIDSLEAKHLYYGRSFSGSRSSAVSDKFEFIEWMRKGAYDKAIEEGERLVYDNPTDLELLGLLTHAYSQKDPESKNHALRGLQFSKLVETVIKNGSTAKDSASYTIMTLGDQYVLAGIMQKDLSLYQRSSKPWRYGMTDTWKRNAGKEKLIFHVVYPDFLDR
ncbi:DUF4919 domain-containing protein [Bergeyella sp. RCAD1439]|uniref:DUF4919 domain-containing protein n=1 Tax=Bergeyella anatis TaxID=3113737 RepID=UPI002E17837C|nr:DUF4919 domain-containing protein [Bergeyella sp. RCAD1439]